MVEDASRAENRPLWAVDLSELPDAAVNFSAVTPSIGVMFA